MLIFFFFFWELADNLINSYLMFLYVEQGLLFQVIFIFKARHGIL